MSLFGVELLGLFEIRMHFGMMNGKNILYLCSNDNIGNGAKWEEKGGVVIGDGLDLFKI